MRLESLQLQGFKSFADRTRLEFRDGVTAIIGSNGCGKSNLADAIRWVLGEQRPSAIRGSKMEEVIFQGTSRRRPLNFAEVTLRFDNQAGRVPVPQTELEISRKVFREGGSEYSLNRTACRLKDVHNLLRDSGLGANAYAVIEAPMIEALLSDRAEERRTLFEEAAGVGRYKDSRQAAMRRLEAAEADLTRLDDLIAEVESKVKSLGRQKRRAERHRELLTRRKDLEVAVVRHEVAQLEREILIAEGRRRELEAEERSAAAERSTSDAINETRRIEAADLGRRRIEHAAKLEAVRSELNALEREALLADERRTNAEQRLAQLVEERTNLGRRIETLVREMEAAVAEAERLTDEVDRSRAIVEARVAENGAIRQQVNEARTVAEAAAVRARELAREIAAAEGERAAAERRRTDAIQRRAEAAARLETLRSQLDQLTDQTDLWVSQADEVRDRLLDAQERFEQATEEVKVFHTREQRAREEARAAEDRLSTLSAQVDAREALERSYEGFTPAVAAIMKARDRFPGVLSPLADLLSEGDPARTRAVEAFLGPLLQAVVVSDLATARALREWFRKEWKDGGSLLILPGDAVGDASAGAPTDRWVQSLLTQLEVVEGDALSEFTPGRNRVDSNGDVLDARGVVRLAAPTTSQGLLERRAALKKMRAELRELVRARDARLQERDAMREALEAAEEEAREADEVRRLTEAQLKGVELDAAAHRDRRGRLQAEREAYESELASLDSAATDASADLVRLEDRLKTLAAEVGQAAQAEDAARRRLQELEASWDAARDEEGELKVQLARIEGDLREATRRAQAARQSREGAERRMADALREAQSIRDGLEQSQGLRDTSAERIQALFRSRDEASGALALIDAKLAELDSELAELGERTRAARRIESEAMEERHRLDLQLAEARSKLERLRDRLEAEWGRPFSALIEEANELTEGDPESWRHELRDVAQQLDNLGPVNMLAVEEHAEEDRRLSFLLSQRKDLVESRDNLSAAIREINKTAREVFESTFEAVRGNFHRVFQSLFEGGQCDLWLTDPSDPLESGVEIQASPVGKKTQRIHLLSGGERTLTALALLFALYLVKPSPFCVLDEIDAPLDEANVGRFINLLNAFKHETQFVVITHNPRTMEAADWVYGVTMEEPGISTIVSVELLGAWVEEHPSAVN